MFGAFTLEYCPDMAMGLLLHFRMIPVVGFNLVRLLTSLNENSLIRETEESMPNNTEISFYLSNIYHFVEFCQFESHHLANPFLYAHEEHHAILLAAATVSVPQFFCLCRPSGIRFFPENKALVNSEFTVLFAVFIVSAAFSVLPNKNLFSFCTLGHLCCVSCTVSNEETISVVLVRTKSEFLCLHFPKRFLVDQTKHWLVTDLFLRLITNLSVYNRVPQLPDIRCDCFLPLLHLTGAESRRYQLLL